MAKRIQNEIGLLEVLEEIRENSDPDNLQELETVGECKAAIKFLHTRVTKAIEIHKEPHLEKPEKLKQKVIDLKSNTVSQ